MWCRSSKNSANMNQEAYYDYFFFNLPSEVGEKQQSMVSMSNYTV